MCPYSSYSPRKTIEYYKGSTFNQVVLNIADTDLNKFNNPDYAYRAQIRPSRFSSIFWADVTNDFFPKESKTLTQIELKIVAPGYLFDSIPEGEWEMDLFLFDNSVFPQQRILLAVYDISVYQNVTQVAYNPPPRKALTFQIDSLITGVTDDSKFTIAGAVGTYDAEIYKDGFIVETKENLTGEQVIEFSDSGIYDIRLVPVGSNPLHKVAFGTSADGKKITKLKEFGNIKYSSLNNAFAGCSNMEVVATDIPDISDVTSMENAFNGVTSFDTDVSSWDFSNVVAFDGMLKDTSYNKEISWLNNGMPKSLNNLFENTPLSQDISLIEIGQIQQMTNAFDDTSITTEQYDKAIIKWANDIFEAGQTLQPARTVGVKNIKYSDSVYWDDFYEKEFCKTVEAKYYLEKEHAFTFVGDTADLLIDVHGAHINVLFSGNLHNTALIGQVGQDFVEVERASDNATQIFQATVRGFDKNAIETFCNGSQGFIRWIVNQAGNSDYDSTFGALDNKPFITDSKGILLPDNEIRANNAIWQIGASHVINEQDTGKILLGKFDNNVFGIPSNRIQPGGTSFYFRNRIESDGRLRVDFNNGSSNESLLAVSQYFAYNNNTRNLVMYAQQGQDVIMESNDFGRNTQTLTPTVPTDRSVDDFVTSGNSTINLFIRFDTTDALAANLYEDVLAKSRIVILEEDELSPVTVVPDTATDGTRLANTGLHYYEPTDELIVAEYRGLTAAATDGVNIRVFNRPDITLKEIINIEFAGSFQDLYRIDDYYYAGVSNAYNLQGVRTPSEDLDFTGIPSDNKQNMTTYFDGFIWRITEAGTLIKINPQTMQVVKTFEGFVSTEGLAVNRNFVSTNSANKMRINDRATKVMLIEIPANQPEGNAIDPDENFYVNRDEFFHGETPNGNRLWKYNSRKIGF